MAAGVEPSDRLGFAVVGRQGAAVATRARFLAVTLVAVPAAALIALCVLGAQAPESPLARALALALAPLCHQDPSRSFGHFALCHRCTGIYVGVALGAAAWLLAPRARPALDLRSSRPWIVGIGPMLAQVLVGRLWIGTDLWWLRLATGALFGAVAGFATVTLLAGLVSTAAPAASRGRWGRRRPAGGP
jgi:uncharacterized membrane protein